MKKYVFEDKVGERYTVEANSEKEAWNKFLKQTDYTKDDMDLLFENHTLKSVEPISSHKCPPGYEYVSSYNKSNGEYVKGFCRKKVNR